MAQWAPARDQTTARLRHELVAVGSERLASCLSVTALALQGLCFGLLGFWFVCCAEMADDPDPEGLVTEHELDPEHVLVLHISKYTQPLFGVIRKQSINQTNLCITLGITDFCFPKSSRWDQIGLIARTAFLGVDPLGSVRFCGSDRAEACFDTTLCHAGECSLPVRSGRCV